MFAGTVHSKLPSLSTPHVETGEADRAEPTLGSGWHQPSMGSAYKGSPARPGQIFTTLRNACAAMLAPTVHTKFPSLSTRGGTGGVDKKTTPGNACIATLEPTCPQAPITHCVENPVARFDSRPPWWARRDSARQGGHLPEMTRPANGGPCRPRPVRRRAYSAVPPNLWVYCRLMVRPTLSNQDTS